MSSVIVFFLSTRHLISFYLWLSSILIIIWSYYFNETFVNYIMDQIPKGSSLMNELILLNTSCITSIITNYFLQVFLSLMFCFVSKTHVNQNLLSKRMVGFMFMIPTLISLLPAGHETMPNSSLETSDQKNSTSGDNNINHIEYSRLVSVFLIISPLVSAGIAFFYVILNTLFSGRYIFSKLSKDIQWTRVTLRDFGIYHLIENQWSRLHVPQVLRVFWLTRFVEQALILSVNHYFTTPPDVHLKILPGVIMEAAPKDDSSSLETFLITSVKELLIRGCETVIAVLGMTSVISSISHQIGCFIQWFLASEAPEDRGIGTVSAILFFILALQTGITGMEPEKRFQRLYRNVCLLFTAILHFIHNIVSPQLFSLSASRNSSLTKHSRSLIVCLFLISFPSWFMYYLWSHHTISTWLLAVSAFSIEVVIKVCVTDSIAAHLLIIC